LDYSLDGPQTLDLFQGEVEGEETLYFKLSHFATIYNKTSPLVCKLRSILDIGGMGQIDVMTADLRGMYATMSKE